MRRTRPASWPARLPGNIAMNSGGAHCLKYGVTTNNLLGVTLVKMDGTVVTLGGPWGEPGGLDLLGVVCGSEGQLGVVTEAWLRILPQARRRAAGAGRLCKQRSGGGLCGRHHPGRHPAGGDRVHGPALYPGDEAFAKAGYPDCEALLIIEVEGSEAEIDEQLARIRQIAMAHDPVEFREAADEDQAQADLVGTQERLWRDGADQRLHVSGRDDPGVVPALCVAADRRDERGVRAGCGQCLSCRRRQHAPADPVRCQQAGRSGAVRGLWAPRS